MELAKFISENPIYASALTDSYVNDSFGWDREITSSNYKKWLEYNKFTDIADKIKIKKHISEFVTICDNIIYNNKLIFGSNLLLKQNATEQGTKEELVRIISGLKHYGKKHKYIMFVAGMKKHAIGIYIKINNHKDPTTNYDVTILNSGYGINYHLRISLNYLNIPDICVTSRNVCYDTLRDFIFSLMVAEKQFDDSNFYINAVSLLFKNEQPYDNKSGIFVPEQLSGSCCFRGIHNLMLKYYIDIGGTLDNFIIYENNLYISAIHYLFHKHVIQCINNDDKNFLISIYQSNNIFYNNIPDKNSTVTTIYNENIKKIISLYSNFSYNNNKKYKLRTTSIKSSYEYSKLVPTYNKDYTQVHNHITTISKQLDMTIKNYDLETLGDFIVNIYTIEIRKDYQFMNSYVVLHINDFLYDIFKNRAKITVKNNVELMTFGTRMKILYNMYNNCVCRRDPDINKSPYIYRLVFPIIFHYLLAKLWNIEIKENNNNEFSHAYKYSKITSYTFESTKEKEILSYITKCDLFGKPCDKFENIMTIISEFVKKLNIGENKIENIKNFLKYNNIIIARSRNNDNIKIDETNFFVICLHKLFIHDCDVLKINDKLVQLLLTFMLSQSYKFNHCHDYLSTLNNCFYVDERNNIIMKKKSNLYYKEIYEKNSYNNITDSNYYNDYMSAIFDTIENDTTGNYMIFLLYNLEKTEYMIDPTLLVHNNSDIMCILRKIGFNETIINNFGYGKSGDTYDSFTNEQIQKDTYEKLFSKYIDSFIVNNNIIKMDYIIYHIVIIYYVSSYFNIDIKNNEKLINILVNINEKLNIYVAQNNYTIMDISSIVFINMLLEKTQYYYIFKMLQLYNNILRNTTILDGLLTNDTNDKQYIKFGDVVEYTVDLHIDKNPDNKNILFYNFLFNFVIKYVYDKKILNDIYKDISFKNIIDVNSGIQKLKHSLDMVLVRNHNYDDNPYTQKNLTINPLIINYFISDSKSYDLVNFRLKKYENGIIRFYDYSEYKEETSIINMKEILTEELYNPHKKGNTYEYIHVNHRFATYVPKEQKINSFNQSIINLFNNIDIKQSIIINGETLIFTMMNTDVNKYLYGFSFKMSEEFIYWYNDNYIIGTNNKNTIYKPIITLETGTVNTYATLENSVIINEKITMINLHKIDLCEDIYSRDICTLLLILHKIIDITNIDIWKHETYYELHLNDNNIIIKYENRRFYVFGYELLLYNSETVNINKWIFGMNNTFLLTNGKQYKILCLSLNNINLCSSHTEYNFANYLIFNEFIQLLEKSGEYKKIKYCLLDIHYSGLFVTGKLDDILIYFIYNMIAKNSENSVILLKYIKSVYDINNPLFIFICKYFKSFDVPFCQSYQYFFSEINYTHKLSNDKEIEENIMNNHKLYDMHKMQYVKRLKYFPNNFIFKKSIEYVDNKSQIILPEHKFKNKKIIENKLNKIKNNDIDIKIYDSRITVKLGNNKINNDVSIYKDIIIRNYLINENPEPIKYYENIDIEEYVYDLTFFDGKSKIKFPIFFKYDTSSINHIEITKKYHTNISPDNCLDNKTYTNEKVNRNIIDTITEKYYQIYDKICKINSVSIYEIYKLYRYVICLCVFIDKEYVSKVEYDINYYIYRDIYELNYHEIMFDFQSTRQENNIFYDLTKHDIINVMIFQKYLKELAIGICDLLKKISNVHLCESFDDMYSIRNINILKECLKNITIDEKYKETLDMELYKKNNKDIYIEINNVLSICGSIVDFGKGYSLTEYKLMYEFVFGYILGKKRSDIIDDIYDNKSITSPKKFYQLLMGQGKSTVINPLAILMLSIEETPKYIFSVTLESLVNQTCNNMTKYCGYLTNHKITHIEISRNNDKVLNKNEIYIMSDTSLKAYLLNNITRNNMSDDRYIIYDEIDVICDPIKSEMNYPVSFTNLDEGLYTVIELLYVLISNFYKNTGDDPNIHNIPYPHITSNYDVTSRCYDILCNNKIDDIETNIYFEKKEKFNNFINDEPDNINITTNKEKMYKYFHILHKSVKYIIPSIMKSVCNKHYGLINDDKNEYYFAVPYVADNTPSVDSVFTDTYYKIGYTILVLMYDGLSIDKLRFIVDYMFSEYKRNNTINISKYDILKRKISKGEITEHIIITEEIHKKLCKDTELIREYIIYICDNKLTIPDKCINCSGYDIIDSNFTKMRTGFSGTPFLPYRIDSNDKYKIYNKIKGSTEFSNIDKNISNDINKDSLNLEVDQHNILDNIIGKIIKEKYDSLIDVESFLLNNRSLDVAIKIVEYKVYDYVVFIDDDNVIYYVDMEKNVMKYFPELPNDNIFVYFDQKHITGIDIKQKTNKKALITCREFTRYRDMAQGIYRMRQLEHGQTVDFLVLSKESSILKTRKDILSVITKNEIIYIQQQEVLGKIQNCRTLMRQVPDDYIIDLNVKYNNDIKYVYNNITKEYYNKMFLYSNGDNNHNSTLIKNRLTVNTLKKNEFIKNNNSYNTSNEGITYNLFETKNINININVNISTMPIKKLPIGNLKNITKKSFFMKNKMILYEKNDLIIQITPRFESMLYNNLFTMAGVIYVCDDKTHYINLVSGFELLVFTYFMHEYKESHGISIFYVDKKSVMNKKHDCEKYYDIANKIYDIQQIMFSNYELNATNYKLIINTIIDIYVNSEHKTMYTPIIKILMSKIQININNEYYVIKTLLKNLCIGKLSHSIKELKMLFSKDYEKYMLTNILPKNNNTLSTIEKYYNINGNMTIMTFRNTLINTTDFFESYEVTFDDIYEYPTNNLQYAKSGTSLMIWSLDDINIKYVVDFTNIVELKKYKEWPKIEIRGNVCSFANYKNIIYILNDKNDLYQYDNQKKTITETINNIGYIMTTKFVSFIDYDDILYMSKQIIIMHDIKNNQLMLKNKNNELVIKLDNKSGIIDIVHFFDKKNKDVFSIHIYVLFNDGVIIVYNFDMQVNKYKSTTSQDKYEIVIKNNDKICNEIIKSELKLKHKFRRLFKYDNCLYGLTLENNIICWPNTETLNEYNDVVINNQYINGVQAIAHDYDNIVYYDENGQLASITSSGNLMKYDIRNYIMDPSVSSLNKIDIINLKNKYYYDKMLILGSNDNTVFTNMYAEENIVFDGQLRML